MSCWDRTDLGTYEEQKHKKNRKMQKVKNTQNLLRFDNLPTSSWVTPFHYIWEVYSFFSLKIWPHREISNPKISTLRKYIALYLQGAAAMKEMPLLLAYIAGGSAPCHHPRAVEGCLHSQHVHLSSSERDTSWVFWIRPLYPKATYRLKILLVTHERDLCQALEGASYRLESLSFLHGDLHEKVSISCKWIYKIKTRYDGSIDR